MHNSQLHLGGFFSPNSPAEYAGYLVVTILVSQLPEILSDTFSKGIRISLSIILLALLFFWWWRRDEKRKARIQTLLSFKIVKDTKPANAKGLILLLSPFRPPDTTLINMHDLKERILQQQVSELALSDFNKIGIDKSNLRPQLGAVKYHSDKKTLHDVWLIASKDARDTQTILEKFLRLQYGLTLSVHTTIEGVELLVDVWDYKRIWELGELIFRKSGYSGYGILADITGGNKMMSVALAMACVPPGRRMQYVYCDRDEFGEPLQDGRIDPVLIDVDPILYAADTK